MLLYRHFRLKKYGEPIPVPRKIEDEEMEDMDLDDAAMLEKIQNMLNKKFNIEPITEAKR